MAAPAAPGPGRQPARRRARSRERPRARRGGRRESGAGERRAVGDGDEALSRVAALVRDIPDFPEPGVVFRDITPVLADSDAFTVVAVALAALSGRRTWSSGSRHGGSSSVRPSL